MATICVQVDDFWVIRGVMERGGAAALTTRICGRAEMERRMECTTCAAESRVFVVHPSQQAAGPRPNVSG